MTRLEILEEMLRRYNDIEDPTTAGTGIRGTGDRLPRMNPEWNHSYRELERCLKLLRQERPSQYAHLRARYIGCATASIECHVRNGKIRLPAHCELAAGQTQVGAKTIRVQVRRWDPWVDNQKVKRALEWISDHFRGEPYLPLELLAA